jgi:hypothetical protein
MTASVYLVSFNLILQNILHRTKACATSIHNNLDYVWTFAIISDSFPNYIDIHIIWIF